jgi:hypothetical protein
MEKGVARNERWFAAKYWVKEKNKKAMKTGDHSYKWWSQKRDDFDLWIDFGFLYSTRHFFQKPHYDYKVVQDMMENWSAFIGLTNSGMFLQIWPQRPEVPRNRGRGKVINARMKNYPCVGGVNIFIPKGVGLAVGGDTCHGGGILCEPSIEFEKMGHPRFHCYVREKRFDEAVKQKNVKALPTRPRTRGTVHSSGVRRRKQGQPVH